MHEMKVNDMYNKDVTIRPDGRVLHTMYLVQVKKPDESKYPWDYYKPVRTVTAEEAFGPDVPGDCVLK
jgi:branched-chain amino acid transport system substrate-binding protein